MIVQRLRAGEGRRHRAEYRGRSGLRQISKWYPIGGPRLRLDRVAAAMACSCMRETDLWRETSASPRRSSRRSMTARDRRASRRLIGAPMFAGSSPRETAPPTTRRWRSGSPRSAVALGPRCSRPGRSARARSVRVAAGDVLLAFSSSGEMRDVIEALDAGAPRPFAAITASPESTIGSRADAVALVTVASQNAITHTQAFCGNVVAALSVWAALTDDPLLHTAVRARPPRRTAVATAETWAEPLARPRARRRDRLRLASRLGGALEGASAAEGGLWHPGRGRRDSRGRDVRDVSRSPRPPRRQPADRRRPAADEAEGPAPPAGATVLRAPGGDLADPRLSAVTTFPATVALAARLGLEAGLDVDAPAWTDAYYAVARGAA